MLFKDDCGWVFKKIANLQVYIILCFLDIMKKTAIILIAVMSILVVVGAIVIFSGNSGSSAGDDPNSPKNVYLAYHGEFEKINTFDDYIALLNKYGTEEVKSQLYKFEEYKSLFGEKTMSLLKSSTPKISEFTDIKETISGNDATLVISTSGSKQGLVILQKEDDSWKIVKADWNNSISANYTTTTLN